ncbi:MAG: tyrosine--tRNA ligase [Deltaproteobacteria bacterium]|nr:tyrosine--tRNA ligase [Deltaproteobacteria bacterium]
MGEAEITGPFSRGAVHLETRADLAAKLAARDSLVVKAGFDPTAPDLHLGHTVLINKMKEFQDAGHRVVFIVGDFTALIGDPTGRNVARKPLGQDAIRANAETYKEQVFRILDPDRTEIRFNSEWLSDLGTEGIVRLAAKYTVSRMLERDDFKKRFKAETSIAIHEFLYPLLQAYDSVAIEADVELGGSDQLFNLLVGRAIQRDYGQEPQVVLTMPLLEGTDGKLVNGKLTGAKMSKSLGNYVGITQEPRTQFLKVMGISDDLMWRYYELLSEETPQDVKTLRTRCESGQDNPRDAKEGLAVEIVRRFHGDAAAQKAREEGNLWLRKRTVDESSIPEMRLAAPPEGAPLIQSIRDLGVAVSASEVRRKIKEGAVWVGDERLSMDSVPALVPGQTYKVRFGRKKVVKIVVVQEPVGH